MSAGELREANALRAAAREWMGTLSVSGVSSRAIVQEASEAVGGGFIRGNYTVRTGDRALTLTRARAVRDSGAGAMCGSVPRVT